MRIFPFIIRDKSRQRALIFFGMSEYYYNRLWRSQGIFAYRGKFQVGSKFNIPLMVQVLHLGKKSIRKVVTTNREKIRSNYRWYALITLNLINRFLSYLVSHRSRDFYFLFFYRMSKNSSKYSSLF